MSDAVVVALAGVDRATAQSADVLLGEAPDLALALRWLDEVFTRYPGCLVGAVRHGRGRWFVVTERGGSAEVHHAAPGRRLDLPAVRTAAHRYHERIVRSCSSSLES